jgi:hypothetical protein
VFGGKSVVLLTTTNLAAPLRQWLSLSTNAPPGITMTISNGLMANATAHFLGLVVE